MKSEMIFARLAFDAPVYDDRQLQTGWQDDALHRRGKLRYLRGGEAVQAARLDGKQPVVVSIRRNPQSEEITPDWKMRDRDRGTVFNVRSVVPSDDRRWLEITAESGVAT